MADDVVFRRDGARFVPTGCATGPWAADRLHGGPVFGLLARAIEVEANDPALVVSRLTFDLFRAVPLAGLEVRTEVVRRSARLCLIQASLHADGAEFVRASALALRARETESQPSPAGRPTDLPAPSGPEGLPTESLIRVPKGAVARVLPGYHTRVETRWVPRAAGAPLAIWFRLPIPLVEGEEASALTRAVALSDFANAVASIVDRERSPNPRAYINVDATVYLTRRPSGEWFCLCESAIAAEGGMSVAEVSLHDVAGPIGRVVQARLENRPPGS